MTPRPPAVSAWDISEDLAADLFRAETLARHAGHAIWDAGDFDYAAELLAEASRLTFSDAELRSAISNGTEMGEAA